MERLVFLLSLVIFGAPTWAQDIAPAAKFTTELKDQLALLYSSSLTDTDRQTRLCGLVRENTSLERFGNYTLGRMAQEVSVETKVSFYRGVQAMLARIFDDAFANLNTARVVVEPEVRQMSGLFPDSGVTVVTVTVSQVNRSDNRLQFFIGESPTKKMFIEDAAKNGIRLSAFKQKEFRDLMKDINGSADDRALAVVTELNRLNKPCP